MRMHGSELVNLTEGAHQGSRLTQRDVALENVAPLLFCFSVALAVLPAHCVIWSLIPLMKSLPAGGVSGDMGFSKPIRSRECATPRPLRLSTLDDDYACGVK